MSFSPLKAGRLRPVLLLALMSACTEKPAVSTMPITVDTETITAAQPVPGDASELTFADLTGQYEIVGVRAVTLTATTIDQAMTGDDPRGQMLTIDGTGVHFDGLTCENQSIHQGGSADLFDEDPMLSDLRLVALDGAPASGGALYSIKCDEEPFLEIYRADPRVLAIPWSNSANYLIAEKTLSPEAIRQMQIELKDMKFFNGDPSETWDEESLYGLRAYYSYRDQSEEEFIFNRPAITESLLEGLSLDAE